jgi:hypothetical protein
LRLPLAHQVWRTRCARPLTHASKCAHPWPCMTQPASGCICCARCCAIIITIVHAALCCARCCAIIISIAHAALCCARCCAIIISIVHAALCCARCCAIIISIALCCARCCAIIISVAHAALCCARCHLRPPLALHDPASTYALVHLAALRLSLTILLPITLFTRPPHEGQPSRSANAVSAPYSFVRSLLLGGEPCINTCPA